MVNPIIPSSVWVFAEDITSICAYHPCFYHRYSAISPRFFITDIFPVILPRLWSVYKETPVCHKWHISTRTQLSMATAIFKSHWVFLIIQLPIIKTLPVIIARSMRYSYTKIRHWVFSTAHHNAPEIQARFWFIFFSLRYIISGFSCYPFFMLITKILYSPLPHLS